MLSSILPGTPGQNELRYSNLYLVTQSAKSTVSPQGSCWDSATATRNVNPISIQPFDLDTKDRQTEASDTISSVGQQARRRWLVLFAALVAFGSGCQVSVEDPLPQTETAPSQKLLRLRLPLPSTVKPLLLNQMKRLSPKQRSDNQMATVLLVWRPRRVDRQAARRHLRTLRLALLTKRL